MMTTSINLDGTNFDFTKAVGSIEAKQTVFNPKTKSLEVIKDFGIIMIGGLPKAVLHDLNPDMDEFVHMMDLENHKTILWEAPHHWRMPQVVKALGAFPSASQAAKNGWNHDVPFGLSQWQLKIKNIRGVITIFKAFCD